MHTAFLPILALFPLTDGTISVAMPLLVLMVAVSAVAFFRRAVMDACLLWPVDIVGRGAVHRLVTYGFVHGDIGHLLFNAFSYASIAFTLNEVLGARDFSIVYFGSLILGAIPPVVRHRRDPAYRALGASGAISGLFFCGMLFFPQGKVYLFLLPVGIPYPLFGVLFLAASMVGAKRNLGNIGHDVHLYGAIAGLLLTVLLRPDALRHFIAWLS